MDVQKPLRHLRFDGRTKSEKYRPPSTVMPPPSFPKRNRAQHGKELMKQLNDTEAAIDAINVSVRRTHLEASVSMGAKGGAPWDHNSIPASRRVG